MSYCRFSGAEKNIRKKEIYIPAYTSFKKDTSSHTLLGGFWLLIEIWDCLFDGIEWGEIYLKKQRA